MDQIRDEENRTVPRELSTIESAPQFVLWVPEERVFRPARIEQPDDYIGLDIARNSKYDTRREGLHLRLVGSPYLGPVSFVDQPQSFASSNSMDRRTFDDMKHANISRLQAIVERARVIAQDQKVPYFGVLIVQANEEEPEEEKSEEVYIRSNIIPPIKR